MKTLELGEAGETMVEPLIRRPEISSSRGTVPQRLGSTEAARGQTTPSTLTTWMTTGHLMLSTIAEATKRYVTHIATATWPKAECSHSVQLPDRTTRYSAKKATQPCQRNPGITSPQLVRLARNLVRLFHNTIRSNRHQNKEATNATSTTQTTRNPISSSKVTKASRHPPVDRLAAQGLGPDPGAFIVTNSTYRHLVTWLGYLP